MQKSDKIKEYLKIVCEQIRWKQARSPISAELEAHIADQKNAFIAEGLNEEDATDKSIIEMGDPVDIGTELDRSYRPKIEWSIIILTFILLLIGLSIRFFVTYDSQMDWKIPYSLTSTALGAGFMLLAYNLDFTVIGKYPKAIFWGIVFMTVGVLPIFKISISKSYISFIMLLFPAAFAGIIYSMRNKGYSGIIQCGILFTVPTIIGISIPNFSSVMIYSIACLVLLTLAIARGVFNVKKSNAILFVYVTSVIPGAILFILVVTLNPYILNRLSAVINPYLDARGYGWTIIVTRNIMSGAKFFGHGDLGIYDEFALRGIDTDFLMTYMIYKFGWISFIVIISVIAAFIIRSAVLCRKQKSVLGKLVSSSVLITFTMQVILYVSFNLGIQLFSPLTLPLISYGGASTVINMFLIGILLSVYKSGDLIRDNKVNYSISKNKIFEFVDGKIIIDLRMK